MLQAIAVQILRYRTFEWHTESRPVKRPAKHPSCSHRYKDHHPLSTEFAFSSHVAFRCCGLTHHLRLVGPTRLVIHLIYILLRGFEGRVTLTSTTGFSSLDLLLGVWDGTGQGSVEELRYRTEFLSTDVVFLCFDLNPA